MDKFEELKYIDLVRFDRSYLQPSSDEYSKLFLDSDTLDPADAIERYNLAKFASGLQRYYLAEMTEGYFWLALGISLDLFPTDAARLLVRQRFAIIFRELPSFLSSWGFVFDTQLSDLIWTAVNQNEFFVKMNLKEFEYPHQLASSFEAACLIETRFARDSDARAFVAALNFYYEDLQQAIASTLIVGSKKAFAYLEGRLGVGSGTTIRGFLKLLEYLVTFGFFFEHLAQNKEIENQDQLLFQRRVRQLCGWRLCWGKSQAYQALYGLIDNLGRLDGVVPDELFRYVDIGSLDIDVKRLLSSWREGIADTSVSRE